MFRFKEDVAFEALLEKRVHQEYDKDSMDCLGKQTIASSKRSP